MRASLKPLWLAWVANLGRAPVEGELAEFAHHFSAASPEGLRVALDTYFHDAPPFPTLPGLVRAYRGSAPQEDGADRDAWKAEALLDAQGFARYGWTRTALVMRPLAPVRFRSLFLQWIDVWLDTEGHSETSAQGRAYWPRRRQIERELEDGGWVRKP